MTHHTFRTLLLAGISASLLAGCAAERGDPPPAISYDTDDFALAAATEQPRPVEIVTIPEPLPLPGQLKPFPAGRTGSKDRRQPAERVEAANQAARQEPTKHGYVNAVQIYPYTAGALYRLYAMPEQVSDIALQPGEKLIAVSAGDTVRWVVGDTTSGAGEKTQVHILVKPTAPDLKTNLVITTDRRAYHLELESTTATYMAAVSWHYPKDRLLLLQTRNAAARQTEPIDQGIALERLRFRYEITGDTPSWRPVRAFDDGSKVYIQLPQRIDQGEAPPLFVVGTDGGSELVNYRVRGNYYIVDRLFAAAELRLGKAPQQVVRINRTDGQTVSAAGAPEVRP